MKCPVSCAFKDNTNNMIKDINESKSGIRAIEWVLFVLGIGAIVVSVFALSRTGQTQRIGYVKTGELISKFEGFKEAEQMLQRKHKEWKTNTDTLEAQFRSSLADYNMQIGSLSPAEKRSREELLGKQEQQKTQYIQGVQQRAQQEQLLAMDSIITYINTFIKSYAQNNGYDLILGTTKEGSLLYGKEADDITQQLTTSINQSYKKGSLFQTEKVH